VIHVVGNGKSTLLIDTDIETDLDVGSCLADLQRTDSTRDPLPQFLGKVDRGSLIIVIALTHRREGRGIDHRQVNGVSRCLDDQRSTLDAEGQFLAVLDGVEQRVPFNLNR
jgi:hypothetical protein